MTPVYVDTGVLAKLYTNESNSASAIQLVQVHPAPLPLTEWQELELKTALRLKAFRHEIDTGGLQSSLNHLAADLVAGRWQRPACSHGDVFEQAESLSSDYATIIGCRTLDILHVAAALVIGARDFVTFDARQSELARQVGVNVKTG